MSGLQSSLARLTGAHAGVIVEYEVRGAATEPVIVRYADPRPECRASHRQSTDVPAPCHAWHVARVDGLQQWQKLLRRPGVDDILLAVDDTSSLVARHVPGVAALCEATADRHADHPLDANPDQLLDNRAEHV